MRRDQGLTQQQLEDRCGLDQSIISRLERGRDIKLRTARLFSLLNALGVDRIVLRSRFDDQTMAGFMRRFMPYDPEA
jgi:transcriptional regulator with XRE-family HTH domain